VAVLGAITVQLAVDLWSTAMVFNAGHRLRLAVSGSNAPRFEVNPNNGDDLNNPGPGVAANLGLAIGGAEASFIELPLLAEISADGFESGGTSRWAVTMPPLRSPLE
jgi:predicted acyl esterase